MPHARFSLAQAARFSSATVTAGLLGRQKTGHLLFRDSTFPISAARHLFRSCCALDLELRPGTAMYKSGPRHQIFLFLHPDHLKTRFKRFPSPRRPLSLLSRNLFQKSHPIPHHNPVLSPVAQRSPKLGNSNTGLSSANTASLEFQDIATLQGTSITDDCSSGRVLSCDVQTHQCPSSPANVSSASRLRQRRWDVLRPSD